jgi:hypothetical protein
MKVIVQYLCKKVEQTVKSVKGKDSFLEAAKMTMRDLDPAQPRGVSVILACHRKGLKKQHFYNTYFVLLAAGMTTEAETLRTRFKAGFGIDLAQEPAKA